jgi:phosphoribosylanthranilate isomerase
MFRVKICGITNFDDAQAAAEAGADAIGINFYEKSPRCVDIEQARDIVWGLGGHMKIRVGVFVNMLPSRIREIVTQVGIHAVQLHGDEPPETVAQIAQTKLPPDFQWVPSIIRARRIPAQGVAEITSDINACSAAGVCLAAVLVDAATPGRYGGTGETLSWAGLADHKRWVKQTPLILAGGLTPDNVTEAIRIVRPHGVDVASGVESSPGKKDHAKVRDFVAAAREAFAGYE